MAYSIVILTGQPTNMTDTSVCEAEFDVCHGLLCLHVSKNISTYSTVFVLLQFPHKCCATVATEAHEHSPAVFIAITALNSSLKLGCVQPAARRFEGGRILVTSAQQASDAPKLFTPNSRNLQKELNCSALQ